MGAGPFAEPVRAVVGLGVEGKFAAAAVDAAFDGLGCFDADPDGVHDVWAGAAGVFGVFAGAGGGLEVEACEPAIGVFVFGE